MPNYKGMVVVDNYAYCWDADHGTYMKSRFPMDFMEADTITPQAAALVTQKLLAQELEEQRKDHNL